MDPRTKEFDNAIIVHILCICIVEAGAERGETICLWAWVVRASLRYVLRSERMIWLDPLVLLAKFVSRPS
jgi:hypothetical protein